MLCVIVPDRLRRSADEGAPRRRAKQIARFGLEGPLGPPQSPMRADRSSLRASFPACYAAIRACRRLVFNARHTKSHSPCTFASPRRLKRRNPSTCVIQPLGASDSHLRSAYAARPGAGGAARTKVLGCGTIRDKAGLSGTNPRCLLWFLGGAAARWGSRLLSRGFPPFGDSRGGVDGFDPWKSVFEGPCCSHHQHNPGHGCARGRGR